MKHADTWFRYVIKEIMVGQINPLFSFELRDLFYTDYPDQL